jgi:hypothetical protein
VKYDVRRGLRGLRRAEVKTWAWERRTAGAGEDGRRSVSFSFLFCFSFFLFLFAKSLLYAEEIKAGKICKTGRGRGEEGGERPGVVAPERTGLLDKTTRDGLDAEGESIQANMPNTMTALGRFPAGSGGNNRT